MEEADLSGAQAHSPGTKSLKLLFLRPILYENIVVL